MMWNHAAVSFGAKKWPRCRLKSAEFPNGFGSAKYQTTAPTKSPEMAKLESSWNNFLCKMIRGGFSKKTQNQENFTFKYCIHVQTVMG